MFHQVISPSLVSRNNIRNYFLFVEIVHHSTSTIDESKINSYLLRQKWMFFMEKDLRGVLLRLTDEKYTK